MKMRTYAWSTRAAFLAVFLGTRTQDNLCCFSSVTVEAFTVHGVATVIPSITSNAADRMFMATGGGEESVMGIPTIGQLSSDPFLKQVHHAEFVCGLLQEDDGRETEVVMKRLRAQFSHQDGIRGFLVTFLTYKVLAKEVVIPPAVLTTILEVMDPVNDSNNLISLMCLNVIMPTAMARTHKDPELSKESTRTAARAINLIKAVIDAAGRDSAPREAVTTQCKAILDLATSQDTTDAESDKDEQKYWAEIFERWGYDEVQRADIADAVRIVLAKQ